MSYLDLTTVTSARRSASEWRDQACILFGIIREWRDAVRSGSPEVEELCRHAIECAGSIQWISPYENGREWRLFARVEPELAGAVLAFGKATGSIDWGNPAWEAWDGVDLPWMAELQECLERLDQALAGGPRVEPKVHSGSDYEVPESKPAGKMSETDIAAALHRGVKKSRPFAARFVEFMIGKTEADVEALAAYVYGHDDCDEKENALHSLQTRVHKYMTHYKSRVKYRLSGTRVYKHDPSA